MNGQAHHESNRLRQDEAELLLKVWGAARRSEIEEIVGYPDSAAGIEGAGAIEWEQRLLTVSAADVERTFRAMHELRKKHSRLYDKLRMHYRDGVIVFGYQSARSARDTFIHFWHITG